jgi:hypothetical protein
MQFHLTKANFKYPAHASLALPKANLSFLLILLSYSRDYILSVTDEAAKRRQASRGLRPTTWYKGRPVLTDHSWERMWNSHLNWKRWSQERMGPYYSPI